jgi:DNA-directed RNA polymerase subunit K/omega
VKEELDVDMPVAGRPKPDERFAISPTEGRFLFVQIAAQRAKQLRRGALNRLQPEAPASSPETPAASHRPERVAMEEVRRGFIQFDLSEDPIPQTKTEGPA